MPTNRERAEREQRCADVANWAADEPPPDPRDRPAQNVARLIPQVPIPRPADMPPEVFLYSRVSGRAQDFHPALQAAHRRLTAAGYVVVQADGETCTGKKALPVNRPVFHRMLETAGKAQRPLVLITASRGMRNETFHHFLNNEAGTRELEVFRLLTFASWYDAQLLILGDPDATADEERVFLEQLAAEADYRKPGRPRERSAAEVAAFKECHLDQIRAWRARKVEWHVVMERLQQIAGWVPRKRSLQRWV